MSMELRLGKRLEEGQVQATGHLALECLRENINAARVCPSPLISLEPMVDEGVMQVPAPFDGTWARGGVILQLDLVNSSPASSTFLLDLCLIPPARTRTTENCRNRSWLLLHRSAHPVLRRLSFFSEAFVVVQSWKT